MASNTITAQELLPYVLPDVSDAPDSLVVRQIMFAANDFCIKTGVWDEIQDPVTVIDGVYQYDVDVPKNAQVSTIKNIWLPNREVIAVTMDKLQELMPNWQTATGSGPAYYNAAQDWTSFRLFPIPEQAGNVQMTLRAAYAPDQFGNVLPRFLADRWLDEICAGAKSRLMLMPKPWRNDVLAGVNEKIYTDGVMEAKIFMAHDKVIGSMRVKPVKVY
ncbi:hypothetical protein [Polynucleobacter sp. UK-Kesae-W10]|uniref:phage adaptor protein n=1 Tax=Polynucleobacter sp. UK-Kesae-W10 TaxID=1819738 RepID=UPI001C0AA94D|nr:hypothetical protein [Polynucleobacter sp. UK-Kesae-W10]MBU3577579.1 hypothetical protein [Polynucleobacter sp. UK-Kesae-W10]